MRTLLFSIMAVLLSAAISQAATVNFTWNANTESDLEGYNLYRAPGSCVTGTMAFAKVAAFGKVVTGSDATVTDGSYCYALTAFDTANNESGQSNRVGVTVNQNPPLPPTGLQTVTP